MAGDFHSYSLRHPDQEKISSRTPSQIVDERIDVLPVFAVGSLSNRPNLPPRKQFSRLCDIL
jgi:hypothetical protein